MSSTKNTDEDLWGFNADELHEDDARYAYVIPSDVTTLKQEATVISSGPTKPMGSSQGYSQGYGQGYGQGFGYSGGGGGGGYSRHEHDGEPAFRIGRVFVGGGSDSGRHALDADVLVDLTAGGWEHDDTDPEPEPDVWGGDFSALNSYFPKKVPHKIEYIGMDWPDGHAPPMPLGFFKAILDACTAKAEREDRDINLVFACMGGHGRTGSALAAVLIACKDYTAADAIRYVREHHCHKACETEKQMKWLCKAAGKGETFDDKDFPLHSYSQQYQGGKTKAPTKKAAKKTTKKTAKKKTASKSAAKGGRLH